MLEDLRLLDLQVGQMIGTSLTLDELAGKRQEEKPKPKPKPEPKPASSYPKLDHKHARLDSEGSSASNTQSPQPSIAAAMQQPKASQWPFLNMYTGKAADMVSLLRAPSQSYAVDEHGIDSQISYSPLAQMVFQGKEEWERKQAASSGSLAKLKRDVEKMNDEELKTKAETAAAQAADAQVFERELRRIEQQHEAASASDEISSPTAVGSNTTIEDVQSNNGNETQTGTGTGKGKQSASQPQPQDEQRPSMRGGSIEAAQGPRPSYASAARSSSRPVIPALPKGVAKRAGEDKKASASGEWRVREGEDWSRSGGFKKGG